MPNGEFIEVTGPPTDEERAVLLSRPDYPQLPAGGESADGVPAAGMRGAAGRLRERAYKVVTESVPLEEARPNGHRNGRTIEGGSGHGNGHAPATVLSRAAEGEQPGSESPPDQGDEHQHPQSNADSVIRGPRPAKK